MPGRRGRSQVRGLDSGTRRRYLNTLGKRFKWIKSRGMVPAGYNPVRDIKHKLTWTALERDFLEEDEVGVYLHAASQYAPERAHGVRYAHALNAVFVYCGHLESEVHQLRVADVNMRRGTIEVRRLKPPRKTAAEQRDAAEEADANTRRETARGKGKKRRLKTRSSVRTISLHPS